MKTLKEFIDMPHISISALYRVAVNELGGVEAFIRFIPCNKEDIKQSLNNGDIHLNKVSCGGKILSSRTWDCACGINPNKSNAKYVGGGVQQFLHMHGICATDCECVCLLKTASIMWAEQ